jgi:hypothetical protein
VTTSLFHPGTLNLRVERLTLRVDVQREMHCTPAYPTSTPLYLIVYFRKEGWDNGSLCWAGSN